jgi:hypothetical protein
MAKVQQQGQRQAKNVEPVVAKVPEETPFRYYVPGDKPKTDQAYFELLLLKLLRSNGDIANFDEVWPRAVQSLAGMNLLRLSTYATHDVREAIAAVGGEFTARMSGHAESIILWSGSMWRIRQVYGTFRRYIRSFEADGFEALLEDLKLRLPGLSPEFLTGYLREAGEKVPVPEKPQGGRPQQQRQSTQPESRTGDQQRRQSQQPQQQQKQDSGQSGRGDRRRRQRGRGGPRPPQQQPAQAGARPQQPQPVAAAQTDSDVSADSGSKDPQQQQRRRNRRRFFRRRRQGSGDKASGAPAAE